MNQAKKLEIIGILGDVRLGLGAESENDGSVDDEINALSNHELIGLYCRYRLGGDDWWESLKSKFDRLEDMDK